MAPRRVAARRRRLKPEACSACVHKHELPTVSTEKRELSPDPKQERESPDRFESEPPGEFVSEELRADCARFLEELWTQIEGRAGEAGRRQGADPRG